LADKFDPLQYGADIISSAIPGITKLPAWLQGKLHPEKVMAADDIARQATALNEAAPATKVNLGSAGEVEFPGAGLTGPPSQAQIQERFVNVNNPTGITQQTQEAFKQAYKAVETLTGNNLFIVPSIDASQPQTTKAILEAITRERDLPLKHQMMQEFTDALRAPNRGIIANAAGPVPTVGNLSLAADIMEKVQAPYMQAMSMQRLVSAANPAGAEMGGIATKGKGPFGLFQEAVRDAMDTSRGMPRSSAEVLRDAAMRGAPGTGAVDQLPSYGFGSRLRIGSGGSVGTSVPWFSPGKMVGTPESLSALNYKAPSAPYVPLSLGLTQSLMRQMGQ
jgi:hypothetical protein